MRETIALSGVPETVQQTRYARVKETKTRGTVYDEKTAALIEELHYDFSLADRNTAMPSGVIARTIGSPGQR